MMLRRLIAAVAGVCLLVCPALADSAVYTLSVTPQKVAAAGSSVLLSSSGFGAIVTTTNTGSPPITLSGAPITQTVCWSLQNDLYAYGTGLLVVTPGVTCPGSTGPTPITPSPLTLTATEVAVPAATSTLIDPANASRRFLRVTNDGTSTCRINYGAASAANTGEPIAASSALYGQGGAITFDAGGLTQQAVYAYCPAASSFAVVEGQ